MAVSTCTVSFKDFDGVTHSATVDAESLIEAVALAVSVFRADKIAPASFGPATVFSVSAVAKTAEHKIDFSKVREAVEPSTKGGPAGILRRERLRKFWRAGRGIMNAYTNE